MIIKYTKRLILFLAIVIANHVAAQNDLNNFNFGLGTGLDDDSQTRLIGEIGHEWRAYSFLGIELKATAGISDKYSDWPEINPATGILYPERNIRDINCSYQSLDTRFNGYLNLNYDERERPKNYLFLGFGIGLVNIQTKGSLESFDGREFESKAHLSFEWFTNFNFGFGGQLSDNVHMKIALFGDNIPFENALAKMDKKHPDAPFSFESSMSRVGLKMVFMYQYQNK